MSEQPIAISFLNDFIFCPVSIYFHQVDYDADALLIKDSVQLDGTAVHEKVDKAEYSSKKSILQGIAIYSHTYNLYGKLDTFDVEKGILTERKKRVREIYDGYIFQLYAQYFALLDMGYMAQKIQLYSMEDNRTYSIPLPDDNAVLLAKFQEVLRDINQFSFQNFKQTNAFKCTRCIYQPLCSYSFGKDV